MATLTVQQAALTGTVITRAAATGGGDDFPNDGRTIFSVKNGSGGALTVTFNSVTNCSYGFDHDVAVSVAAGAEQNIGPFDTVRFGASVGVTYSGVTSLTVAALRSY